MPNKNINPFTKMNLILRYFEIGGLENHFFILADLVQNQFELCRLK